MTNIFLKRVCCQICWSHSLSLKWVDAMCWKLISVNTVLHTPSYIAHFFCFYIHSISFFLCNFSAYSAKVCAACIFFHFGVSKGRQTCKWSGCCNCRWICVFALILAVVNSFKIFYFFFSTLLHSLTSSVLYIIFYSSRSCESPYAIYMYVCA